MLKIALCDDNSSFLVELEGMIKNVIKDDCTIESFNDAKKLLSHIEKYEESFDILFTDIEMPGLDGINLAKIVKKASPETQIVFATNYTTYVQDAFDAEPVYYLVKPYNEEKLSAALKKASENIEKRKTECVVIQTKSSILRITYGDIKYVESDKRTIIIHKFHQDTTINMKLDELAEKLPKSFIRVHKSYLVNMNMICDILNNSVMLFTGDKIPVAKSKYHSVKEEIINFLGDKI